MNIKKIVAPVVGLIVAGLLAACTPAEVASSNLSNDSDNFRIMRRIVFVNGITDKYLLSIEGLCSIKKDNQDNQLEVTCKTGDGEYKKHFLGISDNVTYFVEQMEAAQVDTYHYKVTFQPETILPDIDMQTSSSSPLARGRVGLSVPALSRKHLVCCCVPAGCVRCVPGGALFVCAG